uniref:Uncharacterized protein n=1 Tax=Fagus sylvatica TaxID=28930 RepID=A0A2N9IN62_FAGSY
MVKEVVSSIQLFGLVNGQTWSNLVLVKLGQTWSNLGQTWSNLVKLLVKLGQRSNSWSNLVKWSNLVPGPSFWELFECDEPSSEQADLVRAVLVLRADTRENPGGTARNPPQFACHSLSDALALNRLTHGSDLALRKSVRPSELPRSRNEICDSGPNRSGPPSPRNGDESGTNRPGPPSPRNGDESGTNRPGPPRSRNEICDSGPNRSGPPSPRNGDESGTNRPGPSRSRNEICDSGPNRSGPPSPRNGDESGTNRPGPSQVRIGLVHPALETEMNRERIGPGPPRVRIGLVHPALETEMNRERIGPGPPSPRNEICDSGPNRSGPPSPRNGDESGTNRPGPPRCLIRVVVAEIIAGPHALDSCESPLLGFVADGGIPCGPFLRDFGSVCFRCHASFIEVVVALFVGSECTCIPYFRLSYLTGRHFLNLRSVRLNLRLFQLIPDGGSTSLISGLSSNFSVRGKIAPVWYNKINEFLIPGLRYYHRFGRFCKRCPFAWMM